MSDTAAPSYLIVIDERDGGFGAWAPDLPGCVALGDSIEDAERQMRDAIAFTSKGYANRASRPAPTAVAAVMVTTPAA